MVARAMQDDRRMPCRRRQELSKSFRGLTAYCMTLQDYMGFSRDTICCSREEALRSSLSP